MPGHGPVVVRRVDRQGAAEGALRLRVVRRVDRDPGLLHVGQPERGPRRVVGRHLLQPPLQGRDGGGEVGPRRRAGRSRRPTADTGDGWGTAGPDPGPGPPAAAGQEQRRRRPATAGATTTARRENRRAVTGPWAVNVRPRSSMGSGLLVAEHRCSDAGGHQADREGDDHGRRRGVVVVARVGGGRGRLRPRPRPRPAVSPVDAAGRGRVHRGAVGQRHVGEGRPEVQVVRVDAVAGGQGLDERPRSGRRPRRPAGRCRPRRR